MDLLQLSVNFCHLIQYKRRYLLLKQSINQTWKSRSHHDKNVITHRKRYFTWKTYERFYYNRFVNDYAGVSPLDHVCCHVPIYKHDDVIKWKHFPRYWPFVPGIHRSPVNYPHKGQWRGALMFSVIRVWTIGWLVIWDAIAPIMTSS